MKTNIRRLLAAVAAAVLLGVAAPAARADESFATGNGGKVLAARGADLLWSATEAGRTVLHEGFGDRAHALRIRPLPLDSAQTGDLGTDSHGQEVAIYPRCVIDYTANGWTSCRRYKYVFATGREQLLSAGACSEDDPLIERGTSIWLQRSRYAVSRRPGCPRAEYLQFPGRRPQRMHPPARCLITDLTGGVVACVRDVTTPDRVHGSEVHERTEVYTLRLGSTRWRLVASSASSTDRGGTAGVTLIAPTITGGHVIWLQTTERLEGNARHTTVDVMRAPIGGGRPQRLRRDGRLWVGTGFHPAPPNPPDDQTITFAAVYGALYYGLANVDGHPAIARVAARDLVFE